MRLGPLSMTLIAALLSVQPKPAQQDGSSHVLNITASEGDHVAVAIAVRDHAPAAIAAAAALTVVLDGRQVQHVMLTPGSGRTTYDALVGPLDAGAHRIALEPSPLWTWPAGFTIAAVTSRIVTAADDARGILARAPTFGLRADTIGTASDLLLLVYVEDQRRDGQGWVRYSAIFSNEDGGTPPPALMARWGRTTDIELVYEIEWNGSKVVQERIQAPDHEMRTFRGTREGLHPALLVATLNNMVLDRGRSLVTVRPVPIEVTLDARTRESVMDDHVWTYRVMARELVAEGRVGKEIDDPREFLYVEARLDLDNASVSALAGSDAGSWSDSSRGRDDLTVARNGWVRIAIPAAASATALRWKCHERPEPTAAGPARCVVESTRAFRLDRDYVPSSNLIDPRRLELGPGLSDPQALGRR
jgi:hypothetical protein